MWLEIFMFGNTWFWALSVVELIVLFACIEHDAGGFSYFSVAIFLALIHFFGDASVFSYIANNPYTCLTWGGIYIIVGFFWAIANLGFSTAKLRRKIEGIRKEYKEFKNITVEWDAYMRGKLTHRERASLEFSTYSSRIISWMVYWPISFIWTMLNDSLRRFTKFIYDTILVGVFRKVHSKILGNIHKA